MSVEMIGSDREWERMLLAWRELDVPEGWRAEIREEGIALTPPPAVGHADIDSVVNLALTTGLDRKWRVCHDLGLTIEHLKRLYEPDITVLAAERLRQFTDGTEIPVEYVELVVEIVSQSNARTDRVEKLWAFGQAGVPLYLLIDRFDADGPSVTLYSDPEDGHYRQIRKVPFGKPVELPEPIGLTLETSDFSRR